MIRRPLRRAKARLIRFEQAHPPVLVFGLRRGGSTMVSDAVSACRGVWFANEPYAMFPSRLGFAEKSRRLFMPMHSHFFALTEEEQARFDRFTHDLLRARIWQMGTARDTLPGLKANRTCLKILNAPWMLPWFAAEAGAHIIATTRHPGAQARSVLRQNWGFPVEAYLARPEAMAQLFSAEEIRAAQEIWDSGDPWARGILDWVVTSHPLRHAQGAQVYQITYEEVVRAPERFIDEVLVGKCGLSDRDAMLGVILRPSGSSAMNTAAATRSIAERDVERILNGWREKCSAEELATGQEILDRFGVTEYRFDG
ncbi:MAG: hypothetical protein AAF825_04765 [Pseudomonadota bacterium]